MALGFLSNLFKSKSGSVLGIDIGASANLPEEEIFVAEETTAEEPAAVIA